MAEFPSILAHTYSELVDGLAQLKNFRGLSNETLEALAGLTRGHIDKLFGPARSKSIGKATLPWILGALGARLRIEADPEQEKLMASRWEGRNQSQVRVNAHDVSRDVLQRAAPVIFRELTRNATLAHLTKIPKKKRIAIARKAAKARWRAERRNEHANGHNGHATAK